MEKIKRIKRKTEYEEEKIIKRANLSHDGKQFLVRIPSKISKFFKIKKGNSLEFTVDIPYVKETKKKEMVVEVKRD